MVEITIKPTCAGQEVSNSEAEVFVQLGRILLDSIPEDRKKLNAGKVMAHLAKETIRCVDNGNGPPKISTKTIHTDLGANPNQEPSAWLSPLWKVIEERYYPEIEDLLIERCREMGLGVYPALEKAEGKPAYYWLSSKEIPEQSSDVAPLPILPDTPLSAVQYRKDLTLRLSTAGRLLFKEGMKWTPMKRYSFLTWQLLSLIATVAYLGLVGFVLWYTKGAVTGQHLVLLAMGIGVPWLAYRHITGVWQLFDDRIIIAPDWMLAWTELGATVEIIRSKSSEIPSTIHVNRYSAKCPVCGWMVKLEKGEPDFPRRLVGRCEENPREHVFSFDRSTRLGWPLRAIPHCKQSLPSKEI